MEDFRTADIFQGHLQGIETEIRVKAVGEIPADDIPEVVIHDRHQVEEYLLQRDVRDVGGP